MSRNFPSEAIEWVNEAKWTMELVPLHDVDFDNEDSWAAHHQQDRVHHFAQQLESGESVKPAIMVRVPGKHRLRIVDGHHRTLAYRLLGKPVRAFVGAVPEGDDRWMETHSSQVHQGDDPANKGKKRKGVIAAGIALVAEDTGRLLMLQRAIEKNGKASGKWELPGGKLDPGETPLEAARREWQEEVGCEFPDAELTGAWTSPDGVYRGFTFSVSHEADVPIFDGRDEVENPDDPDGEKPEAVAWWDLDLLEDNPAVREELLENLGLMFNAMGRDSD